MYLKLANGDTIQVPAYDDKKGDILISAANAGDKYADRALRNFACILLREGRVIPKNLANYVEKIVDGKPPTLKTRQPTTVYRNKYILMAIDIALSNNHLATRNEATKAKNGPHSACSLVAEVLTEFSVNLSERGVSKIWENRSKD
jgi:hypothetical protein